MELDYSQVEGSVNSLDIKSEQDMLVHSNGGSADAEYVSVMMSSLCISSAGALVLPPFTAIRLHQWKISSLYETLV